MKRNYANQDHNKETDFFIGYEVEHTPAHGLKTLFVVGVHPVKEILTRANALGCEAVYFGANMSFKIEESESGRDYVSNLGWLDWEDMIIGVLKHPDNFWVTLDFDVKYSEGIVETPMVEYDNFIAMISVKIPYANQMGYNATVKIDDKDFQASNPGVWCHKLHTLMDPNKFTNWKKYKDDKIV